MLAFFISLVLLLRLVASDQEQKKLSHNKPGPYTIFKTEPDFVPSPVKITRMTSDRNLLSPGYVFLAPHLGANGFGPQIIDDDGNLIWYGNQNVVQISGRRPYAMNLRVCDFEGSIGTHLSWSEGRPSNAADQGLKAGGANRIFNNAYEQVVEDLQSFGDMDPPNPHEFNVLPGGETFLQSIYQRKQMDLTPYAGRKDGWVTNGCFQEIDIRARKPIFEWCFLDHYPIWETYMYLHIKANEVNTSSGTSGKGTFNDRWDFMHLNAIDKNEEGDYLVSGRHLSQVLKIAGPQSRSGLKPGSVIWRLSGKHSDFEVEPDAVFGRQHHSRFMSTGKEETLISLFDNANDGVGHSVPTSDMSSAKILRLNNVTKKATLEAIYKSPKKLLSFAQGSLHVQENGNVHVGWGSYPEWTEFSSDGTILLHGEAYTEPLDSGMLTNYRSYKYQWVGRPKTEPKLVAYCQTCNMFNTRPSLGFKKARTSPLVAYVSWNGATEVASYRFAVSHKDRQKGPWVPAGSFPRAGFETRVELLSHALIKVSKFALWVFVEALDKHGEVLGSTTATTFVPNLDAKDMCGIDGCDKKFRFTYERGFSRARTCVVDIDLVPLIIVFALLLLALEIWERLYIGFMTNLVYPVRRDRNLRVSHQILRQQSTERFIREG